MSGFENNASPVDFVQLREVAADDVELINELIDLYLSQTRELLDDLKNGIGEKDADIVYKSAHKALGSSLTCGMNAVAEPLKALEQAGRSSNFENADQLLFQAEKGFAEIDAYLKTNREKLLS